MPRFLVGTAYGLLYAVWALAFIVSLGFAVVSLVSDANDAEAAASCGDDSLDHLVRCAAASERLHMGLVSKTIVEESNRRRGAFGATVARLA